MNENIAYFIGVLNSDGYSEIIKLKDKIRHRIRVHVGEKSLPMIERLKEIFEIEFKRNVKIYSLGLNEYDTEEFYIELSFKKLLPLFEQFGIKKGTVPSEVVITPRFLGSYMAGLIDGDGTTCIKRRDSYPQCVVRIIDGKKSEELEKLIEKLLKCECWIEPIKRGPTHFPTKNEIVGYRHCFYVSGKNKNIFKKLVLPHIQIKHKKDILTKFCEN